MTPRDDGIYLTVERLQPHALGMTILCWRLEVVGIRKADVATTELHPSNAKIIWNTILKAPDAFEHDGKIWLPAELKG